MERYKMRIHTYEWLPALVMFAVLAAPHKSKLHGKFPPKLNWLDYMIAGGSALSLLLHFALLAGILFFGQLVHIYCRYSYNNPHLKDV
jgi:hypothetical protein